MGRLHGKVAIITGGTGGIGLAAAERFIAEGARVLLVDIDAQALREAGARFGDRCGCCAADVTQEEDARRYVSLAIGAFGGVDILLANAGIEGAVAAIPDYSTALFEKVMAVNVTGTWLSMKHAIPAMRARGGGAIVVTASTAAMRGTWGISPYTASKHAVIGLTRTAALECATWNIRVNTINPAPIETRMMRSLEIQRAVVAGEDSADAMKTRLAAAIPMKRYGTPAEIAELMLFLASDASSYCTGGVFPIDGGISAGSV